MGLVSLRKIALMGGGSDFLSLPNDAKSVETLFVLQEEDILHASEAQIH